MTEAPAGTPCPDSRCTHEGHCGVAHTRKAHRLVDILTGVKMDAPLLVRGVCSCGNYRTPVGNDHNVRIAHRDHQTAKLANLAKLLPCVHCPPEVHAAVARRRDAARIVAEAAG